MKENLKVVRKMVMVKYILQMERFVKENFLVIKSLMNMLKMLT